MSKNVFSGVMPALMTPCKADRTPDFDALVRKGKELVAAGMSGVDLLRLDGRLAAADRRAAHDRRGAAGEGRSARSSSAPARRTRCGPRRWPRMPSGSAPPGLMVIPRVLSRGSSAAAQYAHFAGILEAAVDLPAVIYNSPYYGFETKAELFFALHEKYPHLVGFKEFGSAEALSYAAEHITGRSPALTLMVGVDTEVFHGYVNCGATGAITGIGNVLPKEVLHLAALCEKAATGDATARRQAQELEAALEGALDLRRGRRSGAVLQVPDAARGQPRVRAALQPDRCAVGEPEDLCAKPVEAVQDLVRVLGRSNEDHRHQVLAGRSAAARRPLQLVRRQLRRRVRLHRRRRRDRCRHHRLWRVLPARARPTCRPMRSACARDWPSSAPKMHRPRPARPRQHQPPHGRGAARPPVREGGRSTSPAGTSWARSTGLPVYKLLGGRRRTRSRCTAPSRRIAASDGREGRGLPRRGLHQVPAQGRRRRRHRHRPHPRRARDPRRRRRPGRRRQHRLDAAPKPRASRPRCATSMSTSNSRASPTKSASSVRRRTVAPVRARRE